MPQTRQNVETLRARVEDLRARWQQLRTTQRESAGEVTGELSTYDNHPADIGSETFERAKDLALAERLRLELAQAEQALARVEAGTYGVCTRCGRPIEAERLAALPETELCRECAQEDVAHHDQLSRPVEEEVLAPPFLRTRTEEMDKAPVGYDGEDAWQEVERYGTSETPQDLPGAISYKDLTMDADERVGAVEEVETLTPADSEWLLDHSPLFAEPNQAVRDRQSEARRRRK